MFFRLGLMQRGGRNTAFFMLITLNIYFFSAYNLNKHWKTKNNSKKY